MAHCGVFVGKLRLKQVDSAKEKIIEKRLDKSGKL
jgi:hypothetical protein